MSFLIERAVQPVTLPAWRRPFATNCIHLGFWLLLVSVELAIFRRPWLASANAIALFCVLALVNNAKFHSLREPLIYQDIDYCIDVVKHPRLYLPFLGLTKTILGAGIIGLALFLGLQAERELTDGVPLAVFWAGVASIMLVGMICLWLSSRISLQVTFEPTADVRKFGLMSSLWLYGLAERRPYHLPKPYAQGKQPLVSKVALPNLIVVQSESFFDVRRLYADARPSVLQQFDQTKASAAFHGLLKVPAWGANTVRSEFSFLAGVAPSAMGIHQFNPYRIAANKGFPTIASFLKAAGYRTVCVHPYSGHFYGRDGVYPQLGFDEFIDIEDFDGTQKSGPFIGDVPLAERVCELLRASSDKPIFIFVITMENHGPLHMEKILPGDTDRLYTRQPPRGLDDLTIYLRHLTNADRMIGMLRDQLEALSPPALLCWFGDHVPIMPKVYQYLGMPDGKTDYLIWKKGAAHSCSRSLNLSIESLSPLLLQQMGLSDMDSKTSDQI